LRAGGEISGDNAPIFLRRRFVSNQRIKAKEFAAPTHC
jgi:hypothetical protein